MKILDLILIFMTLCSGSPAQADSLPFYPDDTPLYPGIYYADYEKGCDKQVSLKSDWGILIVRTLSTRRGQYDQKCYAGDWRNWYHEGNGYRYDGSDTFPAMIYVNGSKSYLHVDPYSHVVFRWHSFDR